MLAGVWHLRHASYRAEKGAGTMRERKRRGGRWKEDGLTTLTYWPVTITPERSPRPQGSSPKKGELGSLAPHACAARTTTSHTGRCDHPPPGLLPPIPTSRTRDENRSGTPCKGRRYSRKSGSHLGPASHRSGCSLCPGDVLGFYPLLSTQCRTVEGSEPYEVEYVGHQGAFDAAV